jgi:hypothetical protein
MFCNGLILEKMTELFQDNRSAEEWDDEPRLVYAFKTLLDANGE